MQWRGRRGSSTVEDRRNARSSGRWIGGAGRVGLLAVAVAVIGLVFGVDLTALQGGGGSSETATATATATAIERAGEDRAMGGFVSVTLADTEEIRTRVFRAQLGQAYQSAILVLVKGVTDSPCGDASGATGPLSCPGDRKACLDTDFFLAMERQLGPGATLPPPIWWRMRSAILCRTHWAS